MVIFNIVVLWSELAATIFHVGLTSLLGGLWWRPKATINRRSFRCRVLDMANTSSKKSSQPLPRTLSCRLRPTKQHTKDRPYMELTCFYSPKKASSITLTSYFKKTSQQSLNTSQTSSWKRAPSYRHYKNNCRTRPT